MNIIDQIYQFLIRNSFGIKERVQLYRMLAKTTDEKRKGLKIIQVVEHLIKLDKKKSNYSLKLMMHKKWLNDLKGGRPFGEILKKYVPPIEAMIIYSCETSGTISTGFELATDVATMQQKFSSLLIKAVSAAAFNFLSGLLLLTFFCKKIMPNLGNMIPLKSREGLTIFWLSISQNFNKWFPLLIVLLLILIITVSFLMRLYVGNGRKYLDRFPPFSVYRLVIGCSFLYSVNALSKAGIQHAKSLEIMQKFAAPYLRYRIRKILAYMNRGKSLGEAIMNTNLDFPDRDFIDQLELYASQGVLDEMFEQVVLDIQTEGAEFIEKQGAIIKYVGLIINSLLLLFLAIGFFSMVFNMYSAQ